MIKFFRKIRQNMLVENKFSKYLLYAIGEIILVVIGILIALQLNTEHEKKNERDLGYKYLTEMRSEVQDDLISIDLILRRLEINLEKQEAALGTKHINTLPLDSLDMILNPINLDFKISELTFSRMKNLGLTALTDNDDLNTKINSYYNSSVVSLKLSMDYVFEMLKKYLHFMEYEQDAINFVSDGIEKFEFTSLYNETIEENKTTNRKHSIAFITSTRGRMLVLKDVSGKRYSKAVLNAFKAETHELLVAIYKELETKNPDLEPLPVLPSKDDFIEITVPPAMLKKYEGNYIGENEFNLTIFVENNSIYARFADSFVVEIFPYETDKFFDKIRLSGFHFIKKDGEIASVIIGKFEFMKI